jgi:hypothetical protein
MPRTMKRGDLYPAITGTVSDADGPVPLGGASSVTLLLSTTQGGTITLLTCPVDVVAPAAVRDDPDCGKWSYAWQAGDTVKVGTYKAEVEVLWPGSEPQTFPNDDDANETFTIDPDLNPPA